MVLCGELLDQWQAFGPQLDALLCVGLCARSADLAAIWSKRLDATQPDQVDAITWKRLSVFLSHVNDGHKRYVRSQLRLFLEAKQEWRKQRIHSECTGFTGRMFQLFAAGSALSIPLDEFAGVVAKFEGYVGVEADERSQRFVEFLKLFLAAVKASRARGTASSPDVESPPQPPTMGAVRVHIAALQACRAVTASKPPADFVAGCPLWAQVTQAFYDHMDAEIARLAQIVEDSIGLLKKGIVKADADGAKLIRGLCPDSMDEFAAIMKKKTPKMLSTAELLRDLLEDLKVAQSAVGRPTDFVQEVQSAESTRGRMSFMICTWTAIVLHSNPATWAATQSGRDSLSTLASVVTSVTEDPATLAVERQLDTAFWKQLRADVNLPMPCAATDPAVPASGQAAPASGSQVVVADVEAARPVVTASGLEPDGVLRPPFPMGLDNEFHGPPAAEPEPAPALPRDRDADAETVPGVPVVEPLAGGAVDDTVVDEDEECPTPAAMEPLPPVDSVASKAAAAECQEAARKVAAAFTASGQSGASAVASGVPQAGSSSASGQQAPAVVAAPPAEGEPAAKVRRTWLPTAFKSPALVPAGLAGAPAASDQPAPQRPVLRQTGMASFAVPLGKQPAPALPRSLGADPSLLPPPAKVPRTAQETDGAQAVVAPPAKGAAHAAPSEPKCEATTASGQARGGKRGGGKAKAPKAKVAKEAAQQQAASSVPEATAKPEGAKPAGKPSLLSRVKALSEANKAAAKTGPPNADNE